MLRLSLYLLAQQPRDPVGEAWPCAVPLARPFWSGALGPAQELGRHHDVENSTNPYSRKATVPKQASAQGAAELLRNLLDDLLIKPLNEDNMNNTDLCPATT